MKKLITLLVLLMFGFILSSRLPAQEYVKMMNDQSVNFYEVQKKFNEYWAGKTHVRGDGWIQFKRWEEFMAPRVFPTGIRFSPSASYVEYQKYIDGYLNDNNPVFGDWTAIGPSTWASNVGGNPGLGRVNCIQVDPNNQNIIYAGTASGGLWKSIDAGTSWTALNDRFTVLGISSIAIHPGNSNVVYIATGDADMSQTYSVGVLKSIDAGQTWTTTGLSYNVIDQTVISKVLINPNNPNILLASASNGIYKSIDAGVTWVQTDNGGFYRDMEFKPTDPNTVYIAGTGFRKSVDGGNSFNLITSGIPGANVGRIAIGVSPANNNYVYLLICRQSAPDNFLGFYRSANSGSDFNLMSNAPNILGYAQDGMDNGGQGRYDLSIAVSPTDAEQVYTGGINIWKSVNGGTTWTISTYWVYSNTPPIPYVHADNHVIEFVGPKIYTGADGGIFFTANDGASWNDISPGLNITQFYAFGFDPNNPDRIIGGTQDNGTNFLNNGNWNHVSGGDGFEALADYTNPNILYYTVNGTILKSLDGGQSNTPVTNGITEPKHFSTRYVIHPTDPQILYIGYKNVWKTVNGANDWTMTAPLPVVTGDINSLAISQSNPNYLYAANSFGNLFVTANGGTSWTDITNGLPGLSIAYIAIHSTNPSIAFVCFSGYNAGEKVYKTMDAGVTWTNISGTLPNLPANCVTYENGPKEGVYVGMDVGVYYINNQLPNWITYMDGLPNVIVREIEIHYPSNRVRAATFGRGIWQATIASQSVGVENISENVPNNFNLKQNFPNPFNPVTQISYDILRSGYVTLEIYDGLGKEVSTLQSGDQNAGSYKVDFNGSSLASGTYFYRLEVNNNNTVDYSLTKKMILLK